MACWKHAYSQGGKLLVCGNGGSAADSDHIVGELMKGFYKKRPLSDAEKEGTGRSGKPSAGRASCGLVDRAQRPVHCLFK